MSDISGPSPFSSSSPLSLCSSTSGVSNSSSSSIHNLSNVLVFCETCREELTDVSLAEGKHQKHKFSKLEDAVVRQTKKLTRDSKHLKNTPKTCENIRRKTTKDRKQFNETYKEVKENIECHYQELRELLNQNQGHAFNLLEAEKKAMLRSLDLDYKETLTHIQETINQLENQQQTTGTQTQMDEIMKLQESLENMEKFFSALTEMTKCDNAETIFKDSRWSALATSINTIFQKNTELLPQPWEFSDAVTMDKGKMHSDLRFCEKTMQLFIQDIKFIQTNRLATTWFSAVAAQSFSTGQHYWEVEVEGSQSWAVGIVEKSWRVDKGENHLNFPLGRDQASWALECDEGDLVALHCDGVSALESSSVQRLGVWVDCDKGRLKFYDVNAGKLLHKFCTTFSSSIYPAFSLRRIGCKKNSSLTICKLFPEKKYLEEDENSSRNREVSDLAASNESVSIN